MSMNMQSSHSEEAPTREVGKGENRGGGLTREKDVGGLDGRAGGGGGTDN